MEKPSSHSVKTKATGKRINYTRVCDWRFLYTCKFAGLYMHGGTPKEFHPANETCMLIICHCFTNTMRGDTNTMRGDT